ncbi:calcium/calmodulin-dependent protein kinase type II subunit delta isoform 8, partial [Reticulomyxa filosa]
RGGPPKKKKNRQSPMTGKIFREAMRTLIKKSPHYNVFGKSVVTVRSKREEEEEKEEETVYEKESVKECYEWVDMVRERQESVEKRKKREGITVADPYSCQLIRKFLIDHWIIVSAQENHIAMAQSITVNSVISTSEMSRDESIESICGNPYRRETTMIPYVLIDNVLDSWKGQEMELIHELYALLSMCTCRNHHTYRLRLVPFQECFEFYRSKQILGRGGYGSVRLVKHKAETTSVYACKILNKSKLTDVRDIMRGYREILMLRSLNHENVVTFLDSFENAHEIRIILQYLPGGDLLHVIVQLARQTRDSMQRLDVDPAVEPSNRRVLSMSDSDSDSDSGSITNSNPNSSIKGALSPPKRDANSSLSGSHFSQYFRECHCAAFFTQILCALEYIHDRGIVHSDIKPGNILFESVAFGAKLKLIDFGLAQQMSLTVDSNKTVQWQKVKGYRGTPIFMAPEAHRMESYGTAVDMWSAGCVLYILLFGVPPFKFVDFHQIAVDVMQFNINKKLQQDPIFKEVSAEGIDLLKKLMQRDPSRRITASQALLHPFITKTPTQTLSKVRRNRLRMTHCQAKLRAGIKIICMAVRLKELMEDYKRQFEAEVLDSIPSNDFSVAPEDLESFANRSPTNANKNASLPSIVWDEAASVSREDISLTQLLETRSPYLKKKRVAPSFHSFFFKKKNCLVIYNVFHRNKRMFVPMSSVFVNEKEIAKKQQPKKYQDDETITDVATKIIDELIGTVARPN